MQLICPESHGKLGEDVLEGYIKRKSSEIYSLLGQMQTCMSHHSANQRNIKPYYRFTVETRKLDRQIKKKKSPGEKKAHVNHDKNTENCVKVYI